MTFHIIPAINFPCKQMFMYIFYLYAEYSDNTLFFVKFCWWNVLHWCDAHCELFSCNIPLFKCQKLILKRIFQVCSFEFLQKFFLKMRKISLIFVSLDKIQENAKFKLHQFITFISFWKWFWKIKVFYYTWNCTYYYYTFF